MLEDPRSGAVFSSFGADPRAIEAGINTFSDLDFEMGIEGFFRSAERLLRLCTQRPFGSIRRRSLMGP